MRTRITSAVVGLGILSVALVFYDTLLLNLLVFLISALAIYELFHVAGLDKYPFLCGAGVLFCLLLSFRNIRPVNLQFSRLCFGFMVVLFLYQLYRHEILRVEQLCYAFFMTSLVTVSFHCVVLIRETAGAQLGVYYLFFILGSAWLADTGAYFVGTFLGRPKLCPRVSPKKTVEGLVGGIVTAVLGNLLICLAFQYFSAAFAPFAYFTGAVRINIPAVLLATPVLSLLGVLGDLSASLIKRQYDTKDFGNIMPGHGGIMDRFDSVVFICPAVFIIFNIYPLITFI